MKDYEVNWFGDRFFTLATEANIKAMTKSASIVEIKAKQLLSVGGYRGNKYIPSSPDNPPHLRTGVLRASVSSEIVRTPLSIAGWVGSHLGKMRAGMAAHGITATKAGVEYGYFLEVGTRNMQKRPWLRPALIQSRKAINAIFKRANKT